MKSLRPVRVLLLSALVMAAPAWSATVSVTTTDDVLAGADTSLRDALEIANADGEDTVINLGAGLTYTLSLCAGMSEDGNQTGDLDHTAGHVVTIVGNGSTIDQSCPAERVLHGLVEAGVITLEDVTITGGDGGIEFGGGVNSAGRVNLQGATITGNAMGGIFVGTVDAADGGDLLIVHDSTISVNMLFGARIAEGRGVFENSDILGNIGNGLVPSCSRLEVTDSLIEGNTERGIGGVDSFVTVTDSTVRDNGTDGVRSTSPGLGGLVVTILRSTVEGNGDAGVECADCEPLILVNSTVSGNAVGVNATLGTPVELTHTTIVENTTANLMTETGDVTAFATVMAEVAAGTDCILGGLMTSTGSNFDGDNSCGLGAGVGDQPGGGDPLLEPLGNNLGPTQTHRPLPGSPLIDTVALLDCILPADQRGVLRPKGPGCDTGSVERRDPLFVQLDAFTAEVTPQGVVLHWTTSVEIDNMGFRVLRSSGDRREKAPIVISTHVIPPAGTNVSGADYTFVDTEKLSRGIVRYYLQDIDAWGTTTLHGPLTIDLRGYGERTRPQGR